MTKLKSFRVYFVMHHDGRVTGRLLRTWTAFFDEPAPSAYGATENEVYGQLENELRKRQAIGQEPLSRYLWDESLDVRTITVPIHPQTMQKKRPLIGKKSIPLRLSFAWSKMKTGAFRVIVPRFEWGFILEDLGTAPDVLQNAVSSVLLGGKPRWLYDFRHEGAEFIRDWAPELLQGFEEKEPKKDPLEGFPTLNAVAEELVDRASRGKLPRVIDLEDGLERCINLVLRKPPTSLLLVGGPGVGKTTFVIRLARRLAQMRRQKKIERAPRIWRTSGHRIIAGMIYLGQWQERCLSLLRELSGEGDLLYVDRLVSLMQQQPDGSSIAELLGPAMASEEISLVAECSESELERAIRRAPAFVNAFHIVRLPEVAAGQMPALLDRAQARRGIRIHAQGLRLLVRHLQMFSRDLLFPGKAFRFLDWLQRETASVGPATGSEAGVAGAPDQAGPSESDDDGAGASSPPAAGARATGAGVQVGRPATESVKTLYPRDVSEVFARFSGLPLELISDDYAASAEHIASSLAASVIGQDLACQTAARVLARLKAGLNDPEKPVGSLLFVGPTGVGKTELAKGLTRYLFSNEERMVRLDMSEYMLPGSAQRLLEVGGGVTSFAERIRQQPLSLVLLDEIEKAHAEVYDLLLGILGEGRMTDSMGRLVDLRMTVIVMTSNLGSAEGTPTGFGESEGRGDPLRRVRDHFRPEFIGRLDHVVPFRALSPEDILRVVELELTKAGARSGLRRRRLRLDVDDEAKRWLARAGYSPTMGARPLKRVLEERVLTPLAIRMASAPNLRDRVVPVVVEASEAWRRKTADARTEAIILPSA